MKSMEKFSKEENWFDCIETERNGTERNELERKWAYFFYKDVSSLD